MSEINNIAEEVKNLITDEWIKQGHNLTGAFVKGMNYKISLKDGGTVIEFFDTTDQGYGVIINKGVRASEILYPYARKRIKGLTNYANLRLGLTGRDATSFAFAVATKHAKEGMPLPSSSRFSQTGKRTQFTEDATANITEVLERNFKETIKQTIEV